MSVLYLRYATIDASKMQTAVADKNLKAVICGPFRGKMYPPYDPFNLLFIDATCITHPSVTYQILCKLILFRNMAHLTLSNNQSIIIRVLDLS